ncbi:MAG: hypothetical protein IT361_08455 [Gemmatimonadaceae bacterium]|nr:hypothetical protein [Gemmatimonadaceae bacterium]
MRHFYRTHLMPAEVMQAADAFFASLGLATAASSARERMYTGVVGTPEVPSRVRLSAWAEGGHYTFVEVHTDQMGESRIDRNVKRFFVGLRHQEDPRYALEASY